MRAAGAFDWKTRQLKVNLRLLEDEARFNEALATVVHESIHEQQIRRATGETWTPFAARKTQQWIARNMRWAYIQTGLLYRLQPVEADAFNSEAVVMLRRALREGGREQHASDLGLRKLRGSWSHGGG